jgi:chloramphenicol 3-O phosphotransferase
LTFSRFVTPGMGLRPGGERPEIEAHVPAFCAALYDSVAAHSRQGLPVVVDVGHHDAYSAPLHTLADGARRLTGLPTLFVGVRCPIDVVMQRRSEAQADGRGRYLAAGPGDTIPPPVLRWQAEVHRGLTYDLEVDTSLMTPEQCAEAIRQALEHPPSPSAFERLARPAP